MVRKLLRSLWVVVALALVSGCSVELQHDLSEQDANEIYVLLTKKGLTPTKVKGEGDKPTYSISVPKAEVVAAAQLLKAFSLPRPTAEGLAVFKETKGMIPTQTEERAMFIEALAGEVSNSLNRIPGVLEARTIVMLPENNDLTQPDKRPMPTASVLVKYYADADGKKPVSETDLQEFVAKAVPELTKENVKVLLIPSTFAAADEAEAENLMVSVMGLRMTKESASTFRTMLLGGGVGFLLLVVLLAFLVVRKPSGGGGGGRHTGRSRAHEG